MEQEIIDLVAGVLKIVPERITRATTMDDLQEWDSMRNVMILSTLEEHFDIMFPEDDIFDLISIDALVNEVEKLKKA